MQKEIGIDVVTYAPSSPEARSELSRRLAAAHADAVCAIVRELPCPARQKRLLIERLIDAANRDPLPQAPVDCRFKSPETSSRGAPVK